MDGLNHNDMCCDNCRYKLNVEKWDYSHGGCEHTALDGFICSACAYEGTVIWMVGGDTARDICEMWMPKKER